MAEFTYEVTERIAVLSTDARFALLAVRIN